MYEKHCVINASQQVLTSYVNNNHYKTYSVSTAKNGLGEQMGSFCTPRGKHCIHAIIGLNHPINSVFVARQWTGEIYSQVLQAQFPSRDWIVTRILQLQGLEPGFNQGGFVDSLSRFIYIHGTPDDTVLGKPGSHGCIRMRNQDIIAFSDWATINMPVYIVNE